jgi:hypothetical protein
VFAIEALHCLGDGLAAAKGIVPPTKFPTASSRPIPKAHPTCVV